MTLEKLYAESKELHHAYGVVGGTEALLGVREFLNREVGFPVRGNPDYFEYVHDMFGIDEARILKENAHQTAFGDGIKVFVILIRAITLETQNALLKLFEEPPRNVHLFLIFPSEHLVLPTLRSRLCMVSSGTEAASDKNSEAEKFLQLSYPERIAHAKKIIDAKDKAQALTFITELESALAPRLQANPMQYKEGLEAIVHARGYLSDRSPSVKLLLEHLALTLPRA